MGGGRGGGGGMGFTAGIIPLIDWLGVDGEVGGVLRVPFLDRSSLPFIPRDGGFSLDPPIDNFDIIFRSLPEPFALPFSKEIEL